MAPLRSLGNPDISPFDDVFAATGKRYNHYGIPTSDGNPALTGWYGDRAIAGGGWKLPATTNTNEIDYRDITSTGNASDFGNLIQSSRGRAAASNGTRCLWMGGRTSVPGPDTGCEYVTISSTGNGTDFGDLVSPLAGGYASATSDGTRGYCLGGQPDSVDIQYFTFTSTGNGTDFGDMTEARSGQDSASYGSRGIVGGSQNAASSTIGYFTMGTSGNASSFGNLSSGRGYLGCLSDKHGRAVWAGGGDAPSSPFSDTMEYVNMMVEMNANDFGDLPASRGQLDGNGAHNATRGLWMGGRDGPNSTNDIQYITVQTTGNSSEFGDLVSAKGFIGATSGD